MSRLSRAIPASLALGVIVACSEQAPLAPTRPTEQDARAHRVRQLEHRLQQRDPGSGSGCCYSPVNAGIRRYTATPDAIAWLEHNYEPTGNLQSPMLTVHKTRDRLVPFRHQAEYQARVAAVGASGNLVQRNQDAFGHCDFDASYVLSNFQDLVHWVDTGLKP